MEEINRFSYRTFINEVELMDYVRDCEYHMGREIREAALKVLERQDNRLITLCGPSCSGKTTSSRLLTDVFREAGRTSVTISLDSFYRDRAIRFDNGFDPNTDQTPDFESVRTLKMDVLADVVRSVLARQLTEIPLYDFTTGSCSGYGLINARDADFVIFEGIQAVYPEVRALFGETPILPIFINVPDRVEIDGVPFDQAEIRLMRRVVRDSHSRGTEAPITIRMWEDVVENENNVIFPNVDPSSIRIRSYLPYETGMLKKRFLKLTGGVSDAYPEPVNDLIRKLEPIRNIPERMTPASSLLREFIGGRKKR